VGGAWGLCVAAPMITAKGQRLRGKHDAFGECNKQMNEVTLFPHAPTHSLSRCASGMHRSEPRRRREGEEGSVLLFCVVTKQG
jgi:hypothetical protein